MSPNLGSSPSPGSSDPTLINSNPLSALEGMVDNASVSGNPGTDLVSPPLHQTLANSAFDPMRPASLHPDDPSHSFSPNARPPTSAEIDAVIAAAIANAPPPPPLQEIDRSSTPLMTNLLPSAVGADGRVNLFVGNLPYRVRWQDLKDLFRKAGTVLRADVSLGPDNRSRGYGTVLMGSREDAARAIDRFNGFTWQTRTLEVRPDRLPPEYEPQPHVPHHHGQSRPSNYNYHNMPNHPHGSHLPPFAVPGHLGHSPSPWLPNRMGRPPSGHTMQPHHFNIPNQPPSIHPHQFGVSGSSPAPSSHSPPSQYGSGGLPILPPGQSNGASFSSIAPSPLAGSLTTGQAPAAPSISAGQQRRESLSPFLHTPSPEMLTQQTTTSTNPSTAHGSANISRTGSSLGHTGTSSPHRHEGRAAPPSNLGPLPSSAFAGVKSVGSAPSNDDVGATGKTAAAGPPVAIAMEGLSHQGAHMGPPATLHDRVVFVSNLPLNMQWQELKDMLRPAGLIIRADVATDADGRPRGFGTALFATEVDASKAVEMFNESAYLSKAIAQRADVRREISGHRVRVSLERDIISESLSRRGSAVLPNIGLQDNHQATESASHSMDTVNNKPTAVLDSPPAGRFSLSINTTAENGAQGSSRYMPSDRDRTTPPTHSYRHHPPGHITMPGPFAPLDSPGHNPFSPLQRGLQPMTPSMPGFVFNAYPETPPGHPQFMNPGFGPFSPGLPVTSPIGFQYNPFLNPAPGAPVNRFPNQSGSAALGTPSTQSFPGNPVHGLQTANAGPVGAPGSQPPVSLAQAGGYFPAMENGSAGKGQNQNGDQSSPNGRGAAPAARWTAPSPLNAKDRLASTSSSDAATVGKAVNDLADKAGQMKISLDDNLPSLPGTGPPSPTSKGRGGASPLTGAPNSTGTSVRASIDGIRPNLGIWDVNNGERRASFGDIVGGRAKE